MFSFSVSVHLDNLFTDERSRCKLYVSSEHQETVGDFLLKIRKIFDIKDSIDLYIEDFESLYYIPPSEDVRILQTNNIIVVKRNCNGEIKSTGTFYKSKIKKRKRTLSIEDKNEDEAKDNTSEVKEKGNKKNRAMNKKKLNNKSQTSTLNLKELVANEKGQNDITLHNQGSLKNSENYHSNGHAENLCNGVTHMKTDQNILQEQLLPCSTASNNTKDCDYGTMAKSGKCTFTERKPIHTLKISTIPKLIQPIKVVDKETPQIDKKIEDANNISDPSHDSTIKILEDDLYRANNKNSLELSQKLTEHSDAYEEGETNVTKIKNSCTSINSIPTSIDSSINYTGIKEETEKCDMNYFTANFVTKRKRKRHRKKKSCVNKQTEDYCESTQLNETPKTSVKLSAPLIHIKFADDYQMNQKDEERCNDFEKQNQQLESSKLEMDTPNKNEREQNTVKSVILNNNDNTLEEKCHIEKPKSGIRILNDIKICDSFVTNSNNEDKTFTNVITNKNNSECPPELLNSNLNHTINCTKNSKFKPKTTPKCNDKSRISTAMQRAINNYFKELNGNGTSKKETLQHSDSSDSSESGSCNDTESNFAENCLKSKNSSTLDKKQLNCTDKCAVETLQDNENFLNKGCALTAAKEVFSPFLISESDILKKTLMNSKPTKDNIVAFKIVVLTENYTPEVSKFIIAKVLDFQAADSIVKFYVLNGGDQLSQPKGKFSLEDTEEMNTKEITCKWEEILEPRLLYS
ncbi:variant-silencing SET domain-containing protein-like isoform X3 [Agrilus planipennis]|uniref:Variant-silencing SET domain-containing protein-like isoform X3 n=1 Tax=Agrilus planipennis TaxID=224129 RepID=A0A1W4WST5_AGRPL|nr:variant-silencing SET domain-containing protein-like isoform X3 [Agrilus planipennis]